MERTCRFKQRDNESICEWKFLSWCESWREREGRQGRGGGSKEGGREKKIEATELSIREQ